MCYNHDGAGLTAADSPGKTKGRPGDPSPARGGPMAPWPCCVNGHFAEVLVLRGGGIALSHVMQRWGHGTPLGLATLQRASSYAGLGFGTAETARAFTLSGCCYFTFAGLIAYFFT